MMFGKKLILLSVCGAGLLCGMPSESEATWFCDWCTRLFRGGSYTAKYAPVPYTANYGAVPQPGCCTTTCPQTVVNYVPQTSYRTVWKTIPVTTYRPVTSQNPATGCTTTCTQPCTTYQWQAQRVPQTSYRPVYTTRYVTSNNCGSCPTTGCNTGCSTGCNTCGTTNAYAAAPATQQVVPYTAPATPAPYAPTPAPNAPTPVPYSPTPAPGTTPLQPVQPADQQPSLSPMRGSQAYPPRVRTSADASNGPGLKPIRDLDAQQRRWNNNRAPRLLNPQDKTAMRPVRQAGGVVRINWAEPRLSDSAQPAKEEVWDDSGWRHVSR